MPSTFKLTYFNSKGLAESIRYILAYAGQEFEDHRIEKADWPAVKETFAYHKVPVLEVDGKQLNQSVAISRYLGRKFNLVPEDPFVEAQLEALVDNIKDLRDNFKSIHDGTPEAKQEAEKAIKFFLTSIEAATAGGYLYGTKATWVDLYFAGFAETIQTQLNFPTFLDGYPNLNALVEKIRSNDKVKAYIAKRPAPVA